MVHLPPLHSNHVLPDGSICFFTNIMRSMWLDGRHEVGHLDQLCLLGRFLLHVHSQHRNTNKTSSRKLSCHLMFMRFLHEINLWRFSMVTHVTLWLEDFSVVISYYVAKVCIEPRLCIILWKHWYVDNYSHAVLLLELRCVHNFLIFYFIVFNFMPLSSLTGL